MIAALVALAGAAVAFAGGLLAAGPGERRWWRLAAALVAAVVAVGGWRVLGAGDGEVVALQARDAAGQAAQTIVVLQPPEAPREVRRVSLRRPVPAAPFALGAMALGGVLALGVLAAGRRRTRWAVLLPAAGAAATMALLLSASGPAAGEDGVRAALGALNLSSVHVESFTVPPGSWFYGTPVTWAVAVALLAAVAALWGADDRPGVGAARIGVGVGAALAAVAPAVQMSLAGGLPWRPLEGVLWASALLTAGAALEGTSAARRASLAGAGLAVAALALTVAA